MNKRRRSPVDINQVVQYLNTAFSKTAMKASHKIGRAAHMTVTRGRKTTTRMYNYQVDFCYLIDSIQRSPSYIVPKLIQQANELIDDLESETYA